MLKKSMDIIDLYSWSRICSKSLEGCLIDNIYRAKYCWILKLRCGGTTRLLKVETGVRIHLSKSEPPARGVDNMARFLRAHIREGRIVSVDMPWWERVIVLKTSRGESELVHYIELVPRGLWVVTNKGKILYATRFEKFRDRVIKPGLAYQPPPLHGEPPWNRDALMHQIIRGKDLVRGVVTGWGLPGYVAEEILYRAGLYADKNKSPQTAERSQLEQLIDEYSKLIDESLSNIGYLVYRDESLELYSPYRPRLFQEAYSLDVKAVGSFEEALDVYFTEFESFLVAEERKRELLSRVESWKRRVEEQRRLIDEYKKALESVQRTLSIVYGNYTLLDEVVTCVKQKREESGWSAVSECNVSGYDATKGVIYLNLGDLKLELPVYESLERWVLKLERTQGELKKKIEKASSVLRDLEGKSIEVEKKLSERIHTKLAPKYWFEKYRWSITKNGFLVIAGRDASQNEVIVKRYLGDEDIFLHADIYGGPATVLIRSGGAPQDEDIRDAAVLAACYSRAWKAGFSYVDVYWVLGKQVSKSPPSGEFLTRGSFMVYGERSYLRVDLKLGIGLRIFCDSIYGEYFKVFVGPPDLVKETSISYVVIIPGQEGPENLAKRIAPILSEHAYKKTGTKFNLVEYQILEVLPGPSRVVEHGTGRGAQSCEEQHEKV